MMAARIALPETPAFLPHELTLRVWVPRVLGALAALVVPAAILLAARSYAGRSPTSVTQMALIAAGLFLLGAAFTTWTIVRSKLDWRWQGGRRDTRMLARGEQRFRDLLWFDRYAFLGTVIYAILAQVGLEFLGLSDVTTVSWGTIFYWAQNNEARLLGAWW